jgi:hypothetical protein
VSRYDKTLSIYKDRMWDDNLAARSRPAGPGVPGSIPGWAAVFRPNGWRIKNGLGHSHHRKGLTWTWLGSPVVGGVAKNAKQSISLVHTDLGDSCDSEGPKWITVPAWGCTRTAGCTGDCPVSQSPTGVGRPLREVGHHTTAGPGGLVSKNLTLPDSPPGV